MPSFHFNFREGRTLSVDNVGLELDNIEQAYLAAFEAVHDLWREEMRARRDPRRCSFEITDEVGKVLMILPFGEVLESCRRRKNSRARMPSNPTLVSNLDRMKQLSRELGEQLAETRLTVTRTRDTLARLEEARRLVDQDTNG